MEFLDFLKYGAIGISLALAILSYRLLSKEQDQKEVRLPMLKSIKSYFMLAVFLSVFFGLLEVATKVFFQQGSSQNTDIENIWEAHFSDFPDSTVSQKTQRISNAINSANVEIDTSEICEDVYNQLTNVRAKLATYDKGFYQNIIKLKQSLSDDPDGWVNIDYNTSAKADVINALKGIFRSMGNNYDNLSDEEMVAKWKQLKSRWTDIKLQYIFNSDVTGIVREFIKTYEE